MTIFRYLASVALYVALLPLSSFAAFTRAMPHKLPDGTVGAGGLGRMATRQSPVKTAEFFIWFY